MNPSPLYALPFPRSNIQRARHGSHKRKRCGYGRSSGEENERILRDGENVEYSSVVTPIERSQRRLAGQPLDEQLPSFPFPHTQSSSALRSKSKQVANSGVDTEPNAGDSHGLSLRVQHIASMTAVLHKYLSLKDYHRASRAFALLVRTRISGNVIDLRHCGLWGMAAEVLLHSDASPQTASVSRDRFEKVKAFYDGLALQYPWQRRWTSVVDGQEFKSTVFMLWIYTVCAESERMQMADDLDDSGFSQSSSRMSIQAQRWEIDEAEKIAKELDLLLRSVPFIDNLELIRLRGMVALWLADHLETVSMPRDGFESIGNEHNHNIPEFSPTGTTEIRIEEHADSTPQRAQLLIRANDARNVASTLFARLRAQEDDNQEFILEA